MQLFPRSYCRATCLILEAKFTSSPCIGDAFLVVSGSSQPKVYDRDGHELGEFPKGDMYIRDSTHTKGHQYRCCGGMWHPDERCAPHQHLSPEC